LILVSEFLSTNTAWINVEGNQNKKFHFDCVINPSKLQGFNPDSLITMFIKVQIIALPLYAWKYGLIVSHLYEVGNKGD
jgi:hypothetical protein